MVMLVHLTPEKNAARIRRGGIAAASNGRRETGPGLYCVSLLPSYTLTHQWGREIQKWKQQRSFVAVHFRIPDDEPVTVGHYNGQGFRTTSVVQAVGFVLGLEDPRGYEIFLPRAVASSEIHRIRSVQRLTGWRHKPDAHGRRPCECCIWRGEYKSAQHRARLSRDTPVRPREQILADLHDETQPASGLVDLLWELPAIGKGDAFRIAHLADHPSAEVREALAVSLCSFRGRTAHELLGRLRRDPDPTVREAAAEE